MEEWEGMQRLWQYLRPIFQYKDIAEKLPLCASKFV
jgi:hypothetical protein